MTRSLTDKQREHIDAAINLLKLPDGDKRNEAFGSAARQIRRWMAAAIPWDRYAIGKKLRDDADKLDEAQAILKRLYHPTAYALVHEGRYPDGVIPEIDEDEEALSTVLWRKAQRLRRVAEELPRAKKGPKEKAVKDRIWQHTVEQFERYRSHASDADKKAYADRLFQATDISADTQSWEQPERKHNKNKRSQGQASGA